MHQQERDAMMMMQLYDEHKFTSEDDYIDFHLKVEREILAEEKRTVWQ